MAQNLYFSKFAHMYEQNGTTAFFNALRLRPVFLSAETGRFFSNLRKKATLPEHIEDHPDAPMDREDMEQIVSQLRSNKVLIDDPRFDDLVLNHFRSTLGKPYIKTAFFVLTNQCNFDCSYCFVEKDVREHAQSPQKMSIKTAEQALDFFEHQMKLDEQQFDEEKSIILYGGEPLLNKKVACFIIEETARRKAQGRFPDKLNINLITNGSLVDEDLVAFLKKYGVKMSLSVDGNQEATNANRKYINGKPVYQEITRAAGFCRRAELPFGLSVTLSEESLENEEATMNVVKDLGAVSLGLNPLLNADLPIALADDYGERSANFLIRAYEKFRREGISEDRMMRKALAFAHSSIYPFDREAAGGNQVVIAPDGAVGLCHGFLGDKKYFVTDVSDQEFDPTRNRDYLEWAWRSPIQMEACQDCSAIGICGGGCALVGYRNGGSIWGKGSQFLPARQKTLEWMVWDLYRSLTTDSENTEKSMHGQA